MCTESDWRKKCVFVFVGGAGDGAGAGVGAEAEAEAGAGAGSTVIANFDSNSLVAMRKPAILHPPSKKPLGSEPGREGGGVALERLPTRGGIPRERRSFLYDQLPVHDD
jgi:hypothetical protein